MTPASLSGVRKSVQVDGRKLSYLEFGPPDAQPLVLVHGFQGAASNFWETGEALASSYRILAPDLRGHGYSEWHPQGDYSMEGYQADLTSWTQQMGLDRFYLLGHSLGGPTVVIYAARHPDQVARLIVEDPAGFNPPAPAGAARRGAMFPELPLRFNTWEEAEAAATQAMASPRPTEASRQRYLDSNLTRTEEYAEEYVTWRLDRAGLMAWLKQGDALFRADALDPYVKQLRCPTLFIKGGNSNTISAASLQRVAALNPVVRTVEIAGAGHGVHFDKPEEFLATIRQFAEGRG